MEKKKKKIWIIKVLAVLLVILIGFRITLPYIVLRYVNNVLAELDGYRGHVEDIDIHLYRGAYTIDELKIEKTEGKSYVPFFLSEKMHLSIQWKALFKGALVGEVEFVNCALNFVNGAAGTSQTGGENDWREPVKKLFPLKINKLKIANAEVHYRDYSVSPDVNVYIQNMYATVSNLTNSDKLSKTMVADANAHGTVMKSGKFTVKLNFDPYADKPTFDMNTTVEKMNATELNNFFKAYGKFDVQEGTIGIYIEAAAKNGNIKGYVKPLIENLNVLKPSEEKLGPIRFVYEAAIEGLGEIFKNHPKDRIATKVDFSGSLDNPKVNIWSLLTQVLRNAFVHVLLPGIDNTISLQDASAEDSKMDKKEEKKAKKEERKKRKEEEKRKDKQD